MSLYVNIPPSSSPTDYNGTIAVNENFLRGLIPQLTQFSYLKLGQYALGTTTPISVVADGNSEGGAESSAAGTWTGFGSSIYQTCKTGKFGFSMRAKVLGPTAGRLSYLGLANNGASHALVVGTVNASDTTKYVMQLIGGATTTVVGTIVADLGWHDFAVTGDATTISFYVDRVLAGSTTTLTNVADEPLLPAIFNTTLRDAVWADMVYGYVRP